MRARPFHSISASLCRHPIAATAALITLASLIVAILGEWFPLSPTISWISLACGVLSIPFWFPLSLRIEREQKRRRKGLCVVCGYDLRETPQKCPECGTTREFKGDISN